MSKPDSTREVAPRYIAPSRRLTYEDYCRLPSDQRYELMEGAIRVVPSPSVSHQEISKRIGTALISWIEGQRLGKVYHAPLDVVLDQHNVVQPDLLYVSRQRRGIITDPNIQGAPDLVVEIISPATADWDRGKKRALYARFGTRELWLVDPADRSIEVATLEDAKFRTTQVYHPGDTLASRLLPGFSLDVAGLFDRG